MAEVYDPTETDAQPTPAASTTTAAPAEASPVQGPGRVYIGPANETGVDPSTGQAIMKAERPALSADDQAALQHRIAMATQGPARGVVQSPDGGGVGLPDEFIRNAFNNLPIKDAIQATQFAEQMLAQRGYQRDLQGGMSANAALTKWGPLLFKGTAGGLSTLQRAMMPRTATPGQIMTDQRVRESMALRERLAKQAAANAITTGRGQTTTRKDQLAADALRQAAKEAVDKGDSAKAAHLTSQADQLESGISRRVADPTGTETVHELIDPKNPMTSGTRTYKQPRIVAPPTAAPARPAAAAPAPSERVRVVDQKGNHFTVPRSQLDLAKKRGYAEAK